MSSNRPVDFTMYRIAMVDPASWAVLTMENRDGRPRLPCVQIPIRTRVTQQLQKAIVAKWNLRGMVLGYLQSEKSSSPCVVLELLPGNSPDRLRMDDLHKMAKDLSEDERTSLYRILRGDSTDSLPRVGWIYKAVDWVEKATREEIRSLSEIDQLNAGAGFALLRFPMRSGRSYWLKATAEPNRHEQAIALYLSRLCPGCVPDVLAVHEAWNAWIMPDKRANGQFPSDPAKRFQILDHAVTTLAEMQCRTIAHEADLLACGAFDQRLEVLLADSELLFEKIGEAMRLQTSTKVPRVEGIQLHKLHQAFRSTCEYLRSLRVPNTVLHGDMNPGNILWGDSDCQFIDWSETYVGHPLVTLQHLLLLNCPDSNQRKFEWDQALIQRYRTGMSGAFDTHAFDRALVCMPLIAAASALYGRGSWLRRPLADVLYRLARIRTLARHMERASLDPALRKLIGSDLVSIGRELEAATCSH